MAAALSQYQGQVLGVLKEQCQVVLESATPGDVVLQKGNDWRTLAQLALNTLSASSFNSLRSAIRELQTAMVTFSTLKDPLTPKIQQIAAEISGLEHPNRYNKAVNP
jgi:hypothetical protein